MKLYWYHSTPISVGMKGRPSVEQPMEDGFDAVASSLLDRFAASADRLHGGLSLDDLRDGLAPFAPKESGDWSKVTAAVDRYLAGAVRTDSPSFLRSFWGGSDSAAMVGSLLADVRNTTMHTSTVAPAATIIEIEMVRALCAAVGMDGDGVFTTGGSNGNLLGFLCARNMKFPNAVKEGIDAAKLIAFTSEEAHYSAAMAANVSGIGTKALRTVAVDSEGRMDPGALESAILMSADADEIPFVILSTAGTTVRGAFDPIDAIGEIAREHGIWHHVDAAWGGPVIFSKRLRHLVSGMGSADSVTFDAHKMLGCPMVCSAFLTQHHSILDAAMHHTGAGEYLFDDPLATKSLGLRSMQCGRRADAMKLWLSWLLHGSDGFSRKVERCVAVAEHLAARVASESDLSFVSSSYANVCFRLAPKEGESESEVDERTRNARIALEEAGLAMVIDAIVEGRLVIRVAISHPAVDEESVNRFVDDQLTIAATG